MRKLIQQTEKLSIFVEVAKAKSFHKAAVRLRLSQPSLSQAIKILEETLNRRLFNRSRKGVELTEAGEELYRFSERLLSEVEGVENRIRYPEVPMRGSIHIGTYSSLTSYLWPKFLGHLAKEHKGLTISLSSLKADELSQGLQSRSCHLVVGTENLKQKTVTNFPLFKDALGFYFSGRKFSKNLQEVPTTKMGIKKAPLIYIPHAKNSEGLSIEEILRDEDMLSATVYGMDNFEAVKNLTLEGLGIGILPIYLASASLQSGQLERLDIPGLKKFGEHQVFCSVLNEDLNDKRVSTVINELREWCKRF